MKNITQITSLMAVFVMAVISAHAMSNDDILKLLGVGMSDEIILSSIAGADSPSFDTSVAALIALKEAGASDKVLQAVISPGSVNVKTVADAPAPSSGSESISPDVVTIKHGDQIAEMSYVVPSNRTTARGLGFGGVVTYMVMRGDTARLQIDDPQPVFIVSVPVNAQPESYLDLASFAVRRNGSREVLIGGGYMSYSTGIHPDRRMPFTVTPLEDQSKAAKGFRLYEMRPSRPLAKGEYALVFYSGEIAVPGFFGGSNSCFDFSVR